MSRTRRQALGQHFLSDQAVVDRIVAALGATANDVVCEIGAGPGILTRALARHAGRVVALEVDPALHGRLAAGARRWPRADAVQIRLADARTFGYETLGDLLPTPGGRILVAGNLPYSVSKPVLARIFEARECVNVLVLMLQREVAERLVAPPGGRAYGALSVFWQVWADLDLVEIVPPAAFRPPPAIESAVVRAVMRRTARVDVGDPAAFVRVVKGAFASRRKMLQNALRGAGLGQPPGGVEAALARAGIVGTRRAETLTLEEFGRLARCLGAPAPA